MGNAIFITGFSNWGKTTIINSLFNGRMSFYQGKEYEIHDINSTAKFTVDSHSNDDYQGKAWLDIIKNRQFNSPTKGYNLLTALCLSTEYNNNFVELLQDSIFSKYDNLYIFFIKYKYDHLAELLIENILDYGKTLKRVKFIVIDADKELTLKEEREKVRMEQIRIELNKLNL